MEKKLTDRQKEIIKKKEYCLYYKKYKRFFFPKVEDNEEEFPPFLHRYLLNAEYYYVFRDTDSDNYKYHFSILQRKEPNIMKESFYKGIPQGLIFELHSTYVHLHRNERYSFDHFLDTYLNGGNE